MGRYYGVALVLTGKEFDDFCEKYKSINLIDDDTFDNELTENLVRDYNFIMSDKNGVLISSTFVQKIVMVCA